MAWATSCGDGNKIPGRKEDISDGPFGYLTGSSGIGGLSDIKQAYRRRTTENYIYVGVDLAAADAYISEHPSHTVYTAPTTGPSASPGYTTKTRTSRERDGDGGAYRVIVEIEVIYDLAILSL